MSTIIKYKDNTLTTVENETKTIKTANKWLEDNITLEKTDSEDPAVYQDEDGYIVLDDDGNRISTQSLIAHTNETYVAPTGFAYNKVSVRVPISDVTKSIIDRSIQTMVTENDFPELTSTKSRAFYNCASLKAVDLPNVISIGEYAFDGCSSLVNAYFPNATSVAGYIFNNCTNIETIFLPKVTSVGVQQAFQYNSKLSSIALPSLNNSGLGGYLFRGDVSLRTVDIGKNATNIGSYVFRNCTALNTLIFRKTSIFALTNTNAFDDSSLASGGTGCTIYIPKSLYDQLGTGTNDYQSATNWSTIYGYGTITFATIEESPFEKYYGDGTPIYPNDNLIFMPYCTDGDNMPDGQAATSGTFLATPFMRIDGGEKYYTNITSYYDSSNREYNQKIYYYDVCMEYLGGSVGRNQITSAEPMGTMHQVVAPEDARFARIVFRTEYSNTAYFGKSGVIK